MYLTGFVRGLTARNPNRPQEADLIEEVKGYAVRVDPKQNRQCLMINKLSVWNYRKSVMVWNNSLFSVIVMSTLSIVLICLFIYICLIVLSDIDFLQ